MPQGSSPIHHHSSSTRHPLIPQCFNMIHQETQGPSRNIKEAMFICVNDPLLNRNLGKYQLPHIWDILQDTPVLKVKQSKLPPPPYWHYPSGSKPPLNSSLSIQGGGTYKLYWQVFKCGVPKHPLLPYTTFLYSPHLPYTAVPSR